MLVRISLIALTSSFLLLLPILGCGESSPGTSKPRRVIPKVGEVAYLYSDDGGSVPSATSQEAWDRTATLAEANDDFGIREMVLRGEFVPLPHSSRVRVIDLGLMTTEVRVLDGRHANKSVIVNTSHLNGRSPASLNAERERLAEHASKEAAAPASPVVDPDAAAAREAEKTAAAEAAAAELMESPATQPADPAPALLPKLIF